MNNEVDQQGKEKAESVKKRQVCVKLCEAAQSDQVRPLSPNPVRTGVVEGSKP